MVMKWLVHWRTNRKQRCMAKHNHQRAALYRGESFPSPHQIPVESMLAYRDPYHIPFREHFSSHVTHHMLGHHWACIGVCSAPRCGKCLHIALQSPAAAGVHALDACSFTWNRKHNSIGFLVSSCLVIIYLYNYISSS